MAASICAMGEPAGAEKSDHAGPGRRFHHLHRGDAVGHGTADVGQAKTVILFKARITQRFQRQGRGPSQKGVAVR